MLHDSHGPARSCRGLLSLTFIAFMAASGTAQSAVWQPLTPASALSPQPVVRRSPAMAYDSARDVVVMVGGRINQSGSNVLPQETWELDGEEWLLAGPVGPVATIGYNDTTNVEAYYDSQRQVTVAVQPIPGGPARIWEWDGSSWTLAQLVIHPFTYRYDFDVCYDPIRGVGVLFGGTTGSTDFNETWEYDGTTVVRRNVLGPPARWGHAMAWDSSRGVVVMYGGVGSTTFSDMWDWDGSVWQPTPNAAGPGARTFHGLVYDESRSRLVLIGNYSGVAATETWEWDVTAGWSLVPATQSARSNMKAVYDSTRQRVVMFGGAGPALMAGPTATFAYGVASASASVQPEGTGCPGPNGQTGLQAGGTPVMGAYMPVQLTNVPTGPINLGFMWFGFDNQNWNGIPLPASLDPLFPGCYALVAPEIGTGLGTTVTGTLDWGVAVPFAPALDGLTFYLQGGVLVLGFNPGGMVFSNGLACTIGL